MITARFPDIRVVPIDHCLLHEETDNARVARLVARLVAAVLMTRPFRGW